MGEKIKALLKKPVFWIIIAAVSLFAIVRSRMSQSQPQEQGQAPAFQGGGGGGGYTGAPTGTSIEDQLTQQDIASAAERLREQTALFNLDLSQKQRMADLLGPVQQAWANTQEAIQNQLFSQAKVAKSQCPVGDAHVDPSTGQMYCRTPTGGGFRPFKQIGGIIQGVLQGVQNAAPGITQAYLGQQIGFYGASLRQQAGEGQSQRAVSTVTPIREQGSATRTSGMTSSYPEIA